MRRNVDQISFLLAPILAKSQLKKKQQSYVVSCEHLDGLDNLEKHVDFTLSGRRMSALTMLQMLSNHKR